MIWVLSSVVLIVWAARVAYTHHDDQWDQLYHEIDKQGDNK